LCVDRKTLAEDQKAKMAAFDVSGPHKYATQSGSMPQFISGNPNLLVAPVRKHMIQYFPSRHQEDWPVILGKYSSNDMTCFSVQGKLLRDVYLFYAYD